ncbi:hypothetical protein [Pararhodobacter zhoushanensis]|uniref:Uncharacterized protein n=1 Tax=Pararhodobacter zhoushanensis TaxID=2479545 RepID=A0ABT3H2D6_9RHOB|nr:hypothetical protein [Pararhodobacter zhoushanensis]MCW1933918.1 hypothetical protein [Pararhodobacter zhoushanensis]
MSDIFDVFTRGPLAALRAAELCETLVNDVAFTPKIYPSWDSEAAQVTLTATSARDELVQIAGVVTGTPRWLTLNFDLGSTTLQVGDVLCLLIEGSMDVAADLALFLRSATAWGTEDTAWLDPLRLSAENGVTAAFHTLAPFDAICANEGYHTLVIDLPTADFSLTLRAMRLFCIPANHGLASVPYTLSSEA